MKTCTKCGATKPLDAFSRAANGKHGREAACRDCRNALRRRGATKPKPSGPTPLACPDCGWTTHPDAPNPTHSLAIHASQCTGVRQDSPTVLRNGRWVLGPRMVRVWVPDEKETA